MERGLSLSLFIGFYRRHTHSAKQGIHHNISNISTNSSLDWPFPLTDMSWLKCLLLAGHQARHGLAHAK